MLFRVRSFPGVGLGFVDIGIYQVCSYVCGVWERFSGESDGGVGFIGWMDCII